MKKQFKNHLLQSGRPGEIRFKNEGHENERKRNPGGNDHNTPEHPKAKIRTVGNATFTPDSGGVQNIVIAVKHTLGGLTYYFYTVANPIGDREVYYYDCQYTEIDIMDLRGLNPVGLNSPHNTNILSQTKIGAVLEGTMRTYIP